MRARHEEPPLVARLVFPLDPADAADRRRRDQEDLAPVREGQRARFGEPDRVAFLVGRGRIGVDLVEEDVARRHRAQPHGRVGAGHHQHAAGEILRQLRVAAVARPRRADALLQRRTLFDQRVDPLARVALGQLHGRLDREHRPRRVVDHEADPVVARLGRADLRGLHEDDPLRRIAGRERVHDRAHVGRALGPIPAGLGARARAQPAMRVRPLRDGQPGIGREPAAPGPEQRLCAVEGRDLVRGRSGAGRVPRDGRGHGPPEPSAWPPSPFPTPPPSAQPPAPAS
jgi:hypothetical protein